MNTDSQTTRLIELASPLGFEPTVSRILQAIRDAGLLLIAKIDHAAGAKAAGLSMPPTLVILYGHPKGGTPIMQDNPVAALDLPLRLLVRENAAAETLVSFHPIVALLAPLGVPAEQARTLEPAQNLIRKALQA